MVKIKLSYQQSKQLFDKCYNDTILRHYVIFGNRVPEKHSESFYKTLGHKIKNEKYEATEAAPIYEYFFNDDFLREYIETDSRLMAYIIYSDADDPEIKTYLKIRWRF